MEMMMERLDRLDPSGWRLLRKIILYVRFPMAWGHGGPGPGHHRHTRFARCDNHDRRPLFAPAAPAFTGEIELNAAQSRPAWPARVAPPKGASNILLIMTDDVGFAAPSTFGGVIPTPTLDRIANDGLRYTNFHSTSLCSPTREALITGRNHHSVGCGVIFANPAVSPAMTASSAKDNAMIGRSLSEIS
jgi:arylsulfatase